MDKKPLIGVSILAVVLLVVGSLSNVVGYQTVQSSNRSVIKASNDTDMDEPFKYQHPSTQLTWTYFGFIFLVNRFHKDYISFYTILVIWTGWDALEHQPYPTFGLSSFKKIEIPKTYDGILTRHFISISVLKEWP